MATKKPETDELLEEISRLKAELAKKNEISAPAAGAYNGEELVEYTAPIVGGDPNSMKPLFVGVNGETIRLQPGVPVRIKRKFLDAILAANGQQLAAWRYMAEQQQNSRAALSEL